jgi:predicted site-specific integrase-resolvase
MEKDIMNVALYARVSTVDEKSLGTQIEEMRRFCRGRGWQVYGMAAYAHWGLLRAYLEKPFQAEQRQGVVSMMLIQKRELVVWHLRMLKN